MPSRVEDWLRQAERNLTHAERSLELGDYDWACFAAHQAGEMAVKALFRSLNAEAWGHMISAAFDNLPPGEKAPAAVTRSAKALDRHYIPSRHPESFGSGTPGDYYTQSDATRALEDARRVLEFCQGRIRR